MARSTTGGGGGGGCGGGGGGGRGVAAQVEMESTIWKRFVML